MIKAVGPIGNHFELLATSCACGGLELVGALPLEASKACRDHILVKVADVDVHLVLVPVPIAIHQQTQLGSSNSRASTPDLTLDSIIPSLLPQSLRASSISLADALKSYDGLGGLYEPVRGTGATVIRGVVIGAGTARAACIHTSGQFLKVGAVGTVVVGCTSAGLLQIIDTVFEGVEAGVPAGRRATWFVAGKGVLRDQACPDRAQGEQQTCRYNGYTGSECNSHSRRQWAQ